MALLRSAHRQWRERLDVGDHIDDNGAVSLKRAFERTGELARLVDADAYGTHVFGEAGKVYSVEGPQPAAFSGLLAAIGAVEAALRLVSSGVVVDHRHRVDVPPYRGLKLADVIPEAGIASERHHRAIRCR